MKRKNNLYNDICSMNNIVSAFNEVCRNTKNKRRVENLKQYKNVYISRVYKILSQKKYVVGPYNKFTIYEPKKRQIVSQNMQDKIINHLVARYILYPALLPCLLDVNVASRKNMGTSEGIRLAKLFKNKCDIKYSNYYILKCDVSKFFASINHNILKNKLERRIKDKDALKIVFDIIDSNDEGLYIGSMTNQILAIFYLNDMDHFIKETLKIKYYVRYQDDFLIFHPSKQYLKYCLEQISSFLTKERLVLNNKTRIYKNTNNFLFLGRNKNGKYSRYRNIKRKLKSKIFYYKKGDLSLNSLVSSYICYNGLCNRDFLLGNKSGFATRTTNGRPYKIDFSYTTKKIVQNVLFKNSYKLNSLSNIILLTNLIIYFYFIARLNLTKGHGLFLSKTSLILSIIEITTVF